MLNLSHCRRVVIFSALSPAVGESLGDLSPMSGSIVFSVANVEPSFEPALTENPPPTAGVPVHFLCIIFLRCLAG